MGQKFANIKSDLSNVFLNNFITHIPCWAIRRSFFKLFGMEIGKHSRILAGTRVLAPKNIRIGERSYINEYCVLDGRGGLNIGDDVNISMYTIILTAGHSKSSAVFAYRKGAVSIEDHVWIGSRAIVLDKTIMKRASILSAGSVYKGVAESDCIYAGIPAVKVGDRNLAGDYHNIWKPFFR